MWKKLNDILKSADAIMITSAHNLKYFTGFAGGEGFCLVGKNFRYLFVDSRYTIEAKEETSDYLVIEYSGGKLLDELYSKLKDHTVKTLAFEDAGMTVAAYKSYKGKFKGIELVGISKKINQLRMVKTEEEISFIRKAESIGDTAFQRVLPLIKTGVAECEIAAELEYQMRLCGAEGVAFETIVVSGAKSGMPHGKPDGKKMEPGDFVTMDFGCLYGRYCSDMTRTVVIEKASEKHIEIYNTVLKAQLKGLETIQSGIICKDADNAARKIIDDAGYGKYFGHSLGHGVGLLIHELPNLSPLCDITLCKNMVVTCEPGIYIEGFGGVRIEDTVVVKDSGIENLAKSPKDLIICG